MTVPNAPKKATKIRDPRTDERRRSVLIGVVGTVVVLAIIAGIAVWLINSKSGDSDSNAAGPSVASSDGFYRVTGKADSPVVLDLTEDFQCPACRAFESVAGPTIEAIKKMPNVAVRYRPIAFLDNAPTTKYSTRSANLSACVADATASGGNFDVWMKLHNALYAQQPEEGSAGLPDSTLIKIATDAGAPDSIKNCVNDGKYKKWIDSMTKKTLSSGVQATPDIRVNGKQLQLQGEQTPQALMKAINDAAGAAK